MDGLIVKNIPKMCCGLGTFPSASTDTQQVTINFPFTFSRKPIVVVSWCDTANTPNNVSGLTVIKSKVSTTGFDAFCKRIASSSAWYFTWVAIEPDTAW